jgi:hypothetical protein
MHNNLKVLKRARRLGNNTRTLTKNQLAAIVYLAVGSDNDSLRDYECHAWDTLLGILDNAIDNATARENRISAESEHGTSGNNVGF